MKISLLLSLLSTPLLPFTLLDPGESGAPVLVWGDFDGDRLPDLVALDAGGRVRLHRNLGGGELEDVTQSSGIDAMARSASWQDVDADGMADLFLVLLDGRSALYRGLGAGQFEEASRASGLDRAPACSRAHWIDYDRDGHSDLELWTEQGVRLLHNDGSGSLQETPLVWTSGIAADGQAPAPLASSERDAGAAARSPATSGESAARGALAEPGRQNSVFGSHDSGTEALGSGFDASRRGSGTEIDSVPYCVASVEDVAQPGNCLNASSVPALGNLFPLSTELFIDVNGEVGLGTTDPRSQLHLRGSAGLAELRLDTANNNGSSKLLLLENNTDPLLIGGQLAYDGALDQLQLSTWTTGVVTPRMTISRGTGFVGIGTTTPTNRLHVAGVGSNLVKLESSDATATRLVISNTDQTEQSYDIGVTGSAANIGSDKLAIRDVTAGNAIRMTIDTAGNVGIGTGAPTERLHVDGNIRVSNNSDITGLDDLVGFNDLRLSGDSAGGPDFLIFTDGQCGVGEVYTNVALNVTPQPANLTVLNLELSDGTDVFEVQSDQDVFVVGDFFVQNGSKNFILDHPLDPANKGLAHNAVEGPGYYTFYRGNVVLDRSGEAWVQLPDYFDALNTDPSYQLTCVGGYAPVYVADEARGNRFRIAGGKPGLKVSWQVNALRDDPYARDNPYEPVVAKEGLERGRYFYPAGYGAPEALSISRIPEQEAEQPSTPSGSR